MRSLLGSSVLSLLVTLSPVACGGEDGSGSSAGEQIVADVALAPSAGPGVHAIELSEHRVEPGQETVLCEYLPPLEEDLYVSRLDAYQGSSGHHLILFRTLGGTRPAGTVQDCSAGSSMLTMMLVLTPVTAPEGQAAYVEFPEGSALRIPRGTQLIAQAHYLNTTNDTLRVRDVAHLSLVQPENVTRVVHTYGLGSTDFAIPAGGELTDGFECDLPFDMNPLIAVPHMHEQGTAFYADVGTASERTPIIDVPSWEPEMRHVPPVTEYADSAALRYGEGETIRTFCSWRNAGSSSLGFPSEMCALFGYFWSEDPDADDYLCTGDRKVTR